MSDLRFALRYFFRAPAFALTAVLTLALGIGATTGVFAVINAVLLRPLPYATPEDVLLVWAIGPEGNRTWLAPAEIEDLRQRTPALSGIAGLTDMRFALTGSGTAEELSVIGVSSSLFPLLGMTPQTGRPFTSADDAENAPLVAILSDGLWRRRFGADHATVGRTIHLDGRSYTVVGVAPPSFTLLPPSSVFPSHVDVWVPLQTHLPSRGRDVRYLHAIGRLAGGATLADARAQLTAAGVELAAAYPEYRGGRWSFDAVRMSEDVVRSVRPALLVVFAIVSVVLFIACANVGALLLSRATARHREMAIRAAVGASRSRIARQLLTEGIVLATFGGAVGLAIASTVPFLARLPPLSAIPRFDEVVLDWRVTVFAALASMLTALVFAMAPVVELSGRQGVRTGQTLRTACRGQRAIRAGRALAVVQISLSTAVLVIALVLARGFAGVLATDPGFSGEDVVSMRVGLSPRYRTPAEVARFYDQAIERVKQLPGVRNAAAVTQLPLSGAMLGSTFALEQRPDRRVDADLRGITPDYFATLEIPVTQGRPFTAFDNDQTGGVAIVDEAFARHVWPGEVAVGKRIRWIRQPDRSIEVIGVVRAIRHRGLDIAPRETVYRPHGQYPRWSMYLAVRGSASAGLASSVAAAIHAIDPNQPVAEVATMRELATRSVAAPGFGAAFAAALGALAVMLTLVGVYGLFSFTVAQRRREIGIRLALGASPAGVTRLVLKQGMRLAVAGFILGLPLAIAGSRMAAARLAGTPPADWSIVAFVAMALMATTGAACWIPATRAASVSPSEPLRSE